MKNAAVESQCAFGTGHLRCCQSGGICCLEGRFYSWRPQPTLYRRRARRGEEGGAEEGATCGPRRCNCRRLGGRGARVELDGEIMFHGVLDLDRSPARCQCYKAPGRSSVKRTAFAQNMYSWDSGRSQRPCLKITWDPIGGPSPVNDGWNHIEAVRYFSALGPGASA